MMKQVLIPYLLCTSALGQAFDCSTAALQQAHPCPHPLKEKNGAPKISAHFLIWQSKQDGLEFASKSFIPSPPSSATQTFEQKLYIPDFAWRPGLKASFGYNLPYDGWDTLARYTYYHGEFTSMKKHFSSVIAPTGIGLVPLWHYPFIEDASSPITPLRFSNASGNWKLFFNTMDLELAREFLTYASLPIRLHIGAKIAWIQQSYHAEYSNGTNFTALLAAPPAVTLNYMSSNMHFSSSAKEVGPRAGFQSKWQIGHGFSMLADAAFSLLANFQKVTIKYNDTLRNTSTNAVLNDKMRMKDTLREIAPVAEAMLGFHWGYCIRNCSRPVYFGATLAYEAQYWWAQNHARRNYPYEAPGNMWDPKGDLQLHGLNVALQWDY